MVQLKNLVNLVKLELRTLVCIKKFLKFENLFIIPRINKNIKTNFLAYPIIIKPNNFFDRKKLQIFLERNNIQTRPIFSGNILRHPAFKNIISKEIK